MLRESGQHSLRDYMGSREGKKGRKRDVKENMNKYLVKCKKKALSVN